MWLRPLQLFETPIVVFTEESYTSKASHLDNDEIPNLNETTIEFSGVRGPTRYLGKISKNGYRGLYMRKIDNTVIGSVIKNDLT